MPSHDQRIFGLDLMRAVAIAIVVYSHADDLWAAWLPFDPGLGWVDGVDLFFVLSGYLIGGILLRYATLVGVPWHRRLLDFWQRRWLRTLPNYYLFLLVNIAMVHYGLAVGLINVNALAYFVFLQNLYIPVDLFFFESWSLVIEEWFYLLFPILLLILIAVLGLASRRAFLLAALTMIAVPTLLRFEAIQHVASLSAMDQHIRKLVIHRLDGIGYGVLAAWLHGIVAVAWKQRRVASFALGLVGLGIAAWFHGSGSLWFSGTWYFTVSAGCMALMLPLLSTWYTRPAWGRPVEFLSKVSYALYLVHLPVRHLLLPRMEGLSLPLTLVTYVLYWAVCIALAWVVYRYWERPWMALRDRIGTRLLKATPSS